MEVIDYNKFQTITKSDFQRLTPEQKKDFPKEWIGEGYGYKSSKEWDEMSDDELIYIPEAAYTDYPEDCPNYGYSKEDFIVICQNDEVKAAQLFYGCTWQHPETLYEEYTSWGVFSDEDETEED